MDNLRLLLFFALAVVLLLIYQAWVEDYGQSAIPPEVTRSEDTRPSPEPLDARASTDGVPEPKLDSAHIPTPPSPSSAADPVGFSENELVRVETDVLRLDISCRDGFIVSVWLNDYAVTDKDPEDTFRLLKPRAPNLFVAESGLRGSSNLQLPTATDAFACAQDEYVLEPDQNELFVDLTWSHPSGIEVLKRFRFERGSYLIDLDQSVTNQSGEAVAVLSYEQLKRTTLIDPNASRFVYTYTGGVYYSPEDKYKKYSFDDMRDQSLDRVVSDGWIAMIQHYFMAAWIGPGASVETFYTRVEDASGGPLYTIGKYSESVTLPDGVTHRFQNRLFVGPKLQDTLAYIAPGLELAVDYGIFTVLAQPIYWLLSKIHDIVGNWGWSIIILTILIKLAFYKLSETSYKSMANMRKVTPRMQALKDRYGDDKQRLQQAMMDLYKKEKINPLGGCLPILVQIPVFIALYWVLLESVELRHAPFALWIDSLSSPDPFFVLPLIMGVSMFVQQKLNPAPPDPIQAKVMMSLPFVFTIFFAFFPAGLVLYWVVNNLLSITQQWYITQKIEKATEKAKT